MPSKRSSFFDRLTTVINSPARDDDSLGGKEEGDEEGRGTEHMRVEVPIKQSGRVAQVPIATAGEEEGSDIGKLLIDIYEADGNLVIQAMIAGVTPENLQISITRERVTIHGRREMPKDQPEEYYANELYWGEFERVVDLPYEVDSENADAVEKYGLLIIRLPKLDTNKTQELRVKSV